MSTTPTIPFSSVIVADRYRNTKKYGNLESLKASLIALGTIHPIVLSRSNDGIYSLIAGGRRHRALSELGCTELFHASTLTPGRPGFLFSDEVPDHIRKEAELDENLQRLDMDWIDSCLLICDTHLAKKSIDNKWGQGQTAKLLGYSSKTSVSNALIVGKVLRAGDKEILACDSLNEAHQLLLKRQEDKGIAAMQQRVTKPTTHTFLDTITLTLGPKQTFKTEGGETPATESRERSTSPIPSAPVSSTDAVPPSSVPTVEIPLSRQFVLGDSLLSIMPDLPDACFNHIITDIPYGIDMENLSVANLESVSAEHEIEANVAQMPLFLTQAFRLLRPGGFCVFFYDLDHHEKLQAFARTAGFSVQPWPFIACKTSSCSNQAAQYNLTKNFEVAMFCRRTDSVLRHNPKFALNNTSWKAYDFASERKQYANPFAKPFELWKDIFDMVAFPGQSVYDPFAGECSSLRAAANCGLIPFGSEVSAVHYNRGVENLKATYSRIHAGNVSFT